MLVKPIPRYEPNKTYPILVKMGGYCRIVEMLGAHVNAHNDMVAEQQQEWRRKNYVPRPWI